MMMKHPKQTAFEHTYHNSKMKTAGIISKPLHENWENKARSMREFMLPYNSDSDAHFSNLCTGTSYQNDTHDKSMP